MAWLGGFEKVIVEWFGCEYGFFVIELRSLSFFMVTDACARRDCGNWLTKAN